MNLSIVLLGDLNAGVGDEVVEDVVGRLRIPGRNGNGETMIELCLERKLVAGNTVLRKKDIHKYTWMRQFNGSFFFFSPSCGAGRLNGGLRWSVSAH